MATITWNNGAGTQNWEDADNWDTHSVPTNTDDVLIPTGMGTISGPPTIYVNSLTVNGDSQVNAVIEVTAGATFNNTSKNLGTISANSVGSCPLTFNDTSENTGTATVQGSASVLFHGSAVNSGTVNASGLNAIVTFDDTSENSGNVIATGSVTPSWEDSAVNSGSVTGEANINFFNTSENAIGGTVESAATVIFKDTAENNGTVDAVDVIFGNVSFDNDSAAVNSGTVTASNSINAYYPSARPLGGTVTGTVAYNNYTVTSLSSGNWESGSMWTNNSVPKIYADVVIANGHSVGGNPPNAVASITMSGTGLINISTSITCATFTANDYAGISMGTVIVTGTATFNDGSYNQATLDGDAAFRGESSLTDGNITGDAYFYDQGVFAGGHVDGTVYVRQHIADFLVWRDYAHSDFSTDLVLQFPETDIIQTGLL